MPPRPDLATQRAAAASTQDALEVLEANAGAAAALAAATAVGPVIRLIAGLWVTLFGSTTTPADPGTLPRFTRQVRAALRAVDADPARPVRGAVGDALALGTSTAADLAGVDVDPPGPSEDLDGVLADLATAVDDAVGDAEDRLPSVRDFDGAAALIGDLKAAETRADALAREAVVRGVSEGVDRVAEVTGSERIWVAERDGACLECLAYQGRVVAAGEDFPGGLTFRVSDKVRFPDPIPGPPRHRNCRCHTAIYRRQWTPEGETSFQDALRREAQRAVLRFDAGESERARRRAADRLLDRGTRLPKSVQERSRRRIDASEKAAEKRKKPTGPTRGPVAEAGRTPPKVLRPPSAPVKDTTAKKAATSADKAPKRTTQADVDAFATKTWDQRRLTPLQRQAFEHYAGDGFYDINRGLRSGDLSEQDARYVERIDSALIPTPRPLRVTRRVNPDAFGLTDKTLRDHIADLSGTAVTDDGYMSTTLGAPPPSLGGIRLDITVPKGTPAYWLKGIGQNAVENELLIGRGSTLRIGRVHQDRKSLTWIVEAVMEPRT